MKKIRSLFILWIIMISVLTSCTSTEVPSNQSIDSVQTKTVETLKQQSYTSAHTRNVAKAAITDIAATALPNSLRT